MMILSKQQRELLNESIHELNLPIRVINALESRKNVYLVKQLLELTRNELMAMPNFGSKTLEIIFERLAEVGFCPEGSGPSAKERKKLVADRRRRLQEYYTKGDNIG